jgi:hypothetical protein
MIDPAIGNVKLGSVLRDVSLPAEVARAIEKSFQREQIEMRERDATERVRLQLELEVLHRRMDAAHDDKLNGTISDEFWQRKQTDGSLKMPALRAHFSAEREHNRLHDMSRIFELVQRAHSLYLTKSQRTSRTAQKS